MGYPRTCFSLTIGRILDGVSETAHVPLDRVVVMVPENGGSLLSEQRGV